MEGEQEKFTRTTTNPSGQIPNSVALEYSIGGLQWPHLGPATFGSPVLTVLPVWDMASSLSRPYTLLVPFLSKCSWFWHLQNPGVSTATWASLSKLRTQPIPELHAGKLLCIVWPQQICGTLVQAHIKPQHACKSATCGSRHRDSWIHFTIAAVAPWILSAESG